MNLKDDKTKVSIIALRLITSARVEVLKRLKLEFGVVLRYICIVLNWF